MKTFILVLILLFIGSPGFSQSDPGWFQQAHQVSNREYFDVGNKKSKTFTFTGTPYLEEDFVYGSISDIDGNSRYAFLRYNAIEEIVEVKLPGEEQLGVQVLPKVNELTYSLNDYKYIFDSFITTEGEKIEGYIIEYFKGDTFGLYGNPLPKLAEPQREEYHRSKPAHLSVEVEYYIKNEDGLLHRVKLRDRDFKNVLPKSSELNKYMEDNKLKTPQDYAGMLMWLDEELPL